MKKKKKRSGRRKKPIHKETVQHFKKHHAALIAIGAWLIPSPIH